MQRVENISAVNRSVGLLRSCLPSLRTTAEDINEGLVAKFSFVQKANHFVGLFLGGVCYGFVLEDALKCRRQRICSGCADRVADIPWRSIRYANPLGTHASIKGTVRLDML